MRQDNNSVGYPKTVWQMAIMRATAGGFDPYRMHVYRLAALSILVTREYEFLIFTSPKSRDPFRAG